MPCTSSLTRWRDVACVMTLLVCRSTSRKVLPQSSTATCRCCRWRRSESLYDARRRSAVANHLLLYGRPRLDRDRYRWGHVSSLPAQRHPSVTVFSTVCCYRVYLWLIPVRGRLRREEDFYSWNLAFSCILNRKGGCSDEDMSPTNPCQIPLWFAITYVVSFTVLSVTWRNHCHCGVQRVQSGGGKWTTSII